MENRVSFGRFLMRNSAWNALGAGIPIAVAVLVIPDLISRLGVSRFGLLALIWAIFGYFSLFDLGISRAVTKLLSVEIGRLEQGTASSLVFSALVLGGLLGLIAGILLAVFAPIFIKAVSNAAQISTNEVEAVLLTLCASLPFVIVTNTLIGVQEGFQKFRTVNVIRSLSGTMIFLGPWIVTNWTTSLWSVTTVLGSVRLLTAMIYLREGAKILPGLFKARFNLESCRSLFSFGMWVFVSNLVSPLLVYSDRILIGSLLSLSAVTLYAVPYEVVARLSIIPAAIAGVLFPVISKNSSNLKHIVGDAYIGSARLVVKVMLPVLAVAIAFATDLFQLWLPETISFESAHAFQWLTVGLFLNGLARIPQALLHGLGRPDVSAKLHILEFPLYMTLLLWLLAGFGIVGAAVAWTVRMLGDLVGLILASTRLFPEIVSELRWTITIALTGASALSGIVLATQFSEFWILAAIFFAWSFFVLSKQHRSPLVR